LSDITGRVDNFFSKVGVGVGGIGVIETIETAGFGRKEGFEGGMTLKELSDITVGIVCNDFFLKVGVEARTGVGIGIVIGVFRATRITGILKIICIVI